MPPTYDQVLETLKKVKFPGLSRDIVSFGFIPYQFEKSGRTPASFAPS